MSTSGNRGPNGAQGLTFDFSVALRILPSSHTNPVFVLVGGEPIRERRDAEWCLRAVDQCWSQKEKRIRVEERSEATRVYELARQAYRERMQ